MTERQKAALKKHAARRSAKHLAEMREKAAKVVQREQEDAEARRAELQRQRVEGVLKRSQADSKVATWQ